MSLLTILAPGVGMGGGGETTSTVPEPTVDYRARWRSSARRGAWRAGFDVRWASSAKQARYVIETEAFDPTTVAGLKLWLDATTGTYQTVSGAAATADGAPVGQWQDQSGHANHVAQATSGKRPTLKLAIQNGLPVIRFDGVDDVLQCASFALADTGLSVFVVAKLYAVGSYPHFLAYGDTTAGDWGFRTVSNTGKLSFVANDSNSGAGEAAGAVSGTSTATNLVGTGFHVLEGHLSAADTWEIIQDGTSRDSNPVTFAMAASRNLDIGGRVANSLFMQVDIGEVLIYNTPPSSGKKAEIRAYLKSRWDTP